MIKVKRALISVSDKNGLLDFAKGLNQLGIEIISTGGTAKVLKASDIPVKEVSDYTGFPEILDGRIKTLHPAIHGGLLALREKEEHISQLKKFNMGLIDMVVVNLYPFPRFIQKKNVTLEEALENIDIGGPAVVRSAAKNFKSVAVICNPLRYKEILKELDLNQGLLSDTVLMNLAVEAFQHTADYDRIIYDFLKNRDKDHGLTRMPSELNLRFHKLQDLRYGENPHQTAAFYQDEGQAKGLAKLKQLHGKEMSFNNLLDLNSAVEILKDFALPTAVIIKHNNPTGVACASSLGKAFQEAYQCDSLSAFGGIIGLNKKVDFKTAQAIQKSGFMECVIAPAYDKNAFFLLSQKKNLRMIQLDTNDWNRQEFDFKKILGGLLFQDDDNKNIDSKEWQIATQRKPTQSQRESMLFGWKIIKHIRSNAVILVKGTRTIGIGCGQTSRIESIVLAIKKAGQQARDSILISEAFFPKTDNVKVAARAGIRAIIQSGGSIADQDVIKEANRAKMVMVLTGVRHFKH